MQHPPIIFFFFFFNDTATTEIYTLSLHDALPISPTLFGFFPGFGPIARIRHAISPIVSYRYAPGSEVSADRKSTRLNSSHLVISYAVFCLKKKKKRSTSYITTKENRAASRFVHHH